MKQRVASILGAVVGAGVGAALALTPTLGGRAVGVPPRVSAVELCRLVASLDRIPMSPQVRALTAANFRDVAARLEKDEQSGKVRPGTLATVIAQNRAAANYIEHGGTFAGAMSLAGSACPTTGISGNPEP